MTGSCKLNNKIMRGYRRDPVYQAMAIDLAMLGVISKEECEMLIGSGIPSNIRLPDGSAGNLVSEKDLPEVPGADDTDTVMNGDDVNFTQSGNSDESDPDPNGDPDPDPNESQEQ